MDKLPYELVIEIISYNETYNTRFNEIDKNCNIIFNKNKYKSNVYKIMRWYKRNTFNFQLKYVNKTYFIKFFRKYYPIDYFRSFPEFFIKKMNRNDLIEYVNNNLDKNVNKRKKINLILFLNHPAISIQDLCYVGW